MSWVDGLVVVKEGGGQRRQARRTQVIYIGCESRSPVKHEACLLEADKEQGPMDKLNAANKKKRPAGGKNARQAASQAASDLK